MNTLRVIAAERFEGGVLLAFDDDVCVFYSAALLRSFQAQAMQIDESLLDERNQNTESP